MIKYLGLIFRIALPHSDEADKSRRELHKNKSILVIEHGIVIVHGHKYDQRILLLYVLLKKIPLVRARYISAVSDRRPRRRS